jgi:hypothetical protein
MTKKHHKGPDNMYHISGQTFPVLIGSRAQVQHGTAFKTSGGLEKQDLKMNKHGRIVSKKKSIAETKNKRLSKAGYIPKKGTFKLMSKDMGRKTKSRKTKKSR